jgi:hypothetical protein
MGSLSKLREVLRDHPAGLVEDERRGEMVGLLCRVWPKIAGSDETRMESWKLERTEDLSWHPPLLTFCIERHGAIMAGGSSRAEIQHWTVDMDRLEAYPDSAGYRQVRPAAPRLDVKTLVVEVMSSVETQCNDDWLTWSPDRSRVTVRIGRIISGDGPKQTVLGRRKRFGAALFDAMVAAGWTAVAGTTAHTFEAPHVGTEEQRQPQPDPGAPPSWLLQPYRFVD